MTYRVEATVSIDVTDAATVKAIAAGGGQSGGSERDQLEAAAKVGLAELKRISDRYGLTIGDATLVVTQSS